MRLGVVVCALAAGAMLGGCGVAGTTAAVHAPRQAQRVTNTKYGYQFVLPRGWSVAAGGPTAAVVQLRGAGGRQIDVRVCTAQQICPPRAGDSELHASSSLTRVGGTDATLTSLTMRTASGRQVVEYVLRAWNHGLVYLLTATVSHGAVRPPALNAIRNSWVWLIPHIGEHTSSP